MFYKIPRLHSLGYEDMTAKKKSIMEKTSKSRDAAENVTVLETKNSPAEFRSSSWAREESTGVRTPHLPPATNATPGPQTCEHY